MDSIPARRRNFPSGMPNSRSTTSGGITCEPGTKAEPVRKLVRWENFLREIIRRLEAAWRPSGSDFWSERRARIMSASAYCEGRERRRQGVNASWKHVASSLAERFHEGTVIPESSIFLSIESHEDAITLKTEITQNFAGVGKLVGSRYEAHIRGFIAHALEVGLLTLEPGTLRSFPGVRAAFDDIPHARAEFLSDFQEARQAALVLDGVVQERGDGHFFIATVFHDD